ncbi:MAG: hypothetical protein JWQ66_4041 [Mucilaginibacter sp.]|nr:hypothetical protein [Mucilaginibacter sp.]
MSVHYNGVHHIIWIDNVGGTTTHSARNASLMLMTKNSLMIAVEDPPQQRPLMDNVIGTLRSFVVLYLCDVFDRLDIWK